jgi:hypothetical protein
VKSGTFSPIFFTFCRLYVLDFYALAQRHNLSSTPLCRNRVTRLFFFTLGSFFENEQSRPKFGLLFSKVKVIYILVLTKVTFRAIFSQTHLVTLYRSCFYHNILPPPKKKNCLHETWLFLFWVVICLPQNLKEGFWIKFLAFIWPHIISSTSSFVR